MKQLFLVMLAAFGVQGLALTSIYDSPELVQLIEAHKMAVEAAGEFEVYENTWIEPISGGFLDMNCVGDTPAEKVLAFFKDVTESTEVAVPVKLKAYMDFYTVVNNGQDYVACEGSTSVPYYYVTYRIFYNDTYKIGFEIAWED